MFVSRSIGLCILFNLILLCQGQRQRQPHQSKSDGLGFGFPEAEEEDPSKKNAHSKVLVSIPNKCKTGEILYPGDQGDDWVCDCRPAYIYHPPTQQCYPAYTKGPCRNAEYLVLRGNNVIPECVPNPCRWENFVPFRTGCHALDKGGPCTFPDLPNVVGVNETTLEIMCTQDYRLTPITTRFNEDDMLAVNITTSTPTTAPNSKYPPNEPISNGTNFFKNECFVGSIRWTKGECPQQLLIKDIFQIST